MLHDGGWPASVLSGLADLDALDAVVVAAANAPVRPHKSAAFLPEGAARGSRFSGRLTGRGGG